ncbi:MAG: SEC-C domain-containing protein [Gemmataceae bacterium]|nr:SEC-C domain-containing protein [Gemmataceae bacterium]
MRLTEAKIKEAILHPEKLARQEAVLYFSNCFSGDTDVMPLAIQAIEKFGRRQAFQWVHPLEHLAQTEATVEWAIRELHREEDRADDRSRYFPVLSRILCNADPRVVAPRAPEVLQAPGFMQTLTPDFQERLDLFTWDVDRCWKELEDLCQEAVRSETGDVDLERGERIVEALARQGEKYTDRILELLARKVTDFESDPMSWLEIFLVELAGRMRLEPAVPLIVAKLHEMGEILSEESVNALGRIGTDAAAEAVTEGWLAAEWDYRLYATGALEKIHSDTTVRKCLELLPQDPDTSIRSRLADALLAQFAFEGIEPIRQMVERRAYDSFSVDLMNRLVAVSTIMDVTFPELPVWKRQMEEKLALTERRTREALDRFEAPNPITPAAPASMDDYRERKLTPFLRPDKKVGRNDPCPCGSGKKFKKCCMSKE